MRKIMVWAMLCAALLGLTLAGGCADRGVEVRPKGQMILGGSVGG